MRFDTPVYFQHITKGAYNVSTGDYAADKVTEVLQYASVTNSGTETLQLVYGEIRQGSLTIRIQRHYEQPFDRIRIGNKIYRVDMTRRLRNMQGFVISEVQ